MPGRIYTDESLSPTRGFQTCRLADIHGSWRQNNTTAAGVERSGEDGGWRGDGFGGGECVSARAGGDGCSRDLVKMQRGKEERVWMDRQGQAEKMAEKMKE